MAIPAAKVSVDGAEKSVHADKNGDATDDKSLMPPPPQNAAPSIKQDETDSALSDAKSKFLPTFIPISDLAISVLLFKKLRRH